MYVQLVFLLVYLVGYLVTSAYAYVYASQSIYNAGFPFPYTFLSWMVVSR